MRIQRLERRLERSIVASHPSGRARFKATGFKASATVRRKDRALRALRALRTFGLG